MIWIGIDTGTHTGLAVWDSDSKKFLGVGTYMLHEALSLVYMRWTGCEMVGKEMTVIFEDARQRKWYGKGSREAIEAKAQGAGSIKRDCAIWEEFLTDFKIPFRAIPPIKGATKLSAEYFKRLTGYEGKTSNHARDAAMLVFGR